MSSTPEEQRHGGAKPKRAKLTLRVHDFAASFATLAEDKPLRGERVSLAGFSWRLTVMWRTQAATKANGRTLGFFVTCEGDDGGGGGGDDDAWTCRAHATMRVKARRAACADSTRKIEHTFTPDEDDWGYSQFLTHEELTSVAKGFLVNDTLDFEADLEISAAEAKRLALKAKAALDGGKKEIAKRDETIAALRKEGAEAAARHASEMALSEAKMGELRAKLAETAALVALREETAARYDAEATHLRANVKMLQEKAAAAAAGERAERAERAVEEKKWNSEIAEKNRAIRVAMDEGAQLRTKVAELEKVVAEMGRAAADASARHERDLALLSKIVEEKCAKLANLRAELKRRDAPAMADAAAPATASADDDEMSD